MPNPVLLKDRTVVFVLFLVTTILASALFAPQARPAAAQPANAAAGLFFFRSAQDRSKISLVSQAAIRKDKESGPADDVLRLTNESVHQKGAAWYTQQVVIASGFETVFDVRMTNNTGIPADGFSFVIHNDSRGTGAVGDSGGAGGYAGMSKITNSVAIEFDTYQNTELAEPNYPHITLLSNGNQLPTLNVIKPQINLTDKRPHTVKIRYLVDPAPLLEVYWDNLADPVLRQAVNVSSYVGDQAWVGFVASTGSYDQINEIRNWYFQAGRNLNCGLEYDFTIGSGADHRFNPDDNEGRGGAEWPSSTDGEGWKGEGQLAIARGFGLGSGFLNGDGGLDPTLLDAVFNDENPLPVEQIKLTYTWSAANGKPPASTDTLTAEYGIGKLGETPIVGTIELIGAPVVEAGEPRLVSLIELDTPVSKPNEFRIRLESSNPTDLLRLKKLAVCIAKDSSRPPVIPFGAAQACADLLTNLDSRWQPFGRDEFGRSITKQLEIPMTWPSNLTLEPYPEYSLEAPGYPAWMTYDARSWPNILPGGTTPPKLVPCVFRFGGLFYNPQPLPVPPENTPPSRHQIVRFTAVDGTPDTRQMLVLFNYAAYFSVGSGIWCYASDNVFATFAREGKNGSHPDNYGPGYNVPSPVYDCDTLTEPPGSAGPCGSFVGSLFRAMGYFDVDTIAAEYEAENTLDIEGLYYGVDAYVDALSDDMYGSIPSPLILRDENYQSIPVSFERIRTYPYIPGSVDSFPHLYGLTYNGQPHSPVHCETLQDICQRVAGCRDESQQRLNCEGNEGLCIEKICNFPGVDAATCNKAQDLESRQACADARSSVDGHWDKPTHNVDLKENSFEEEEDTDVQSKWEQIKPGDIAITVIETVEYSGDVPQTGGGIKVLYPHIQVVVGWGPKVLGPAYVRQGTDLYPTYESLASLTELQRANFVPYVMDRFSLPGTGKTTGPRPFSFGLWHTATDFWVSSPTQ